MTQTLLILAFLAFAALAAGFAYAWWQASQRLLAMSDGGKAAIEQHVAALMKAQGEITGHVQGLSSRLDGFGQRIGQSMTDTTKSTHESLAKLGERLAIIDKAQQTITTLSGQVVELQHVLTNKQTRGAFGQGRMEAIVRDGLPSNAYAFQHTLPNGTRPDCVIFFPSGPSLVIDAKFPLEAWNGIRAAATPEMTKIAETQFRRDTTKHIQDIADRYFVPGETQDTAFMFVPSESIFADIHERFEDVVQKAHRARVVIVSPSLLMLSIQVVTSLLRDQRMREQAHVIQQEVALLMEDVGRLDERVKKLQLHFGQANKDVEDILISTKKIAGRGERIEQVEVNGAVVEAPKVAARPAVRQTPRMPAGPELPL
ncbi:MAG: DNA recombination protein RmuC [Bauldia sp.]